LSSLVEDVPVLAGSVAAVLRVMPEPPHPLLSPDPIPPEKSLAPYRECRGPRSRKTKIMPTAALSIGAT
jgi:hypothetical protein